MPKRGDVRYRIAITVRVPKPRLRQLMRARRAKSQSELINKLLEEEEERLRSYQALRETHGKLKRSVFDDRLL